MCALPRRNPPNPTTQEKGKVINLESEEEDIEDIPMDDEDLGVEVEEVEVEGSDPITKLPEYVPPRKGKTKVQRTLTKVRLPCTYLYCQKRSSLKDRAWGRFHR